ncbi:MAG: NAD(P)H-dependent oxidoreductase [Candidatus Omnitrophica bacterium]|nr:NAD(P)H-dependent oxidoreductase [Candidatus Omnitrophota bacterium]
MKDEGGAAWKLDALAQTYDEIRNDRTSLLARKSRLKYNYSTKDACGPQKRKNMKKIAVIYYSRSGNTERMAKLVAEGASLEPDVEVTVSSVKDFAVEKALEYNALIIGSPTYYGSMAAEIKRFFDDSVRFHGRLSGKVGAAFSSAANIGGGNETTIMDILCAMLIHGMVVAGDHAGDHYGPVSIGSPDARVEKQCRALGRKVAALSRKL